MEQVNDDFISEVFCQTVIYIYHSNTQNCIISYVKWKKINPLMTLLNHVSDRNKMVKM